jgi:selenophosphate synthetase-related protein
LLADAAQGPEWNTAREIWERIRAASQEFGVPLPEGQPLLIADFD